jgi:hypothetical protein
VGDAAGALDLDGLLRTFQDLKACFREEFTMCGIAWISCQFAHPLLLRRSRGVALTTAPGPVVRVGDHVVME